MTDRLAEIGSARRFAHADGELWVLPASLERAAKRLVELGRAGVGGFISVESVDSSITLLRRGGPDLDTWLAGSAGAIEWPLAVAMIASLAEATRACEQASLFPGAITNDQLVVRGDAIELRADSLVHAMVGAPSVEVAAPKWMPADAIRPDNASNRYAIGLVAYRLVTGEHPFAGRGLRLGLDDQAVRGAPPFTSQIAATLPPGLQSLCLRMLSPDPSAHPATSAAIATALRDLLRARPNSAAQQASSRRTASRVSAETSSGAAPPTVGRAGDATTPAIVGRSSSTKTSNRPVPLAPRRRWLTAIVAVVRSPQGSRSPHGRSGPRGRRQRAVRAWSPGLRSHLHVSWPIVRAVIRVRRPSGAAR